MMVVVGGEKRMDRLMIMDEKKFTVVELSARSFIVTLIDYYNRTKNN